MVYVNRVTILFMLFACSCVIYYCDCEVSDASNSDEDDKLKEALQLVEILKSEYARVLQENDSLRLGSSVAAEISTCPTTKASNAQTSTVNDTTEVSSLQTTPLHSQAHVVTENPSRDWSQLPFPARNFRRYPPRYFRRFMKTPMDYYYYDIPKFRRFHYEDAFGAHPNDTVRPTTETAATTQTTSTIVNPPTSSILTTSPTTLLPTTSTVTSTTTSTKSTPSSTTSQNLKRPTPRVIMLNPPISSEVSSIATILSKPLKSDQALEKEIHKLHLMQPESDLITSSVDPVLSQIASELIYEFKTERTSFQPMHSKIVHFMKPKRKKNFVTENWWQQAKIRKTTYKIYLSGSKKIPIPYPENHAFCHTNPENALCRTLIK